MIFACWRISLNSSKLQKPGNLLVKKSGKSQEKGLSKRHQAGTGTAASDDERISLLANDDEEKGMTGSED